MKQVITREYIKEYLVAHDYTCELVSTEYINCDSKLALRCECGNVFHASWSNIKKMYGLCKECTNLRRTQTKQAYQARANEFYGDGLYIKNIGNILDTLLSNRNPVCTKGVV